MNNLPTTGKIVSHELETLDDGTRRIRMDVHAESETIAMIGFWIKNEVSENVFQGTIGVVEVDSSQDKDSPWLLMGLMNTIGMTFEATVDLNTHVLSLTEGL